MFLATDCEPLCEEPRQTRFSNLLLHGRQIVFYPQLLDQIVFSVVNAIGRAPISIAWLPHATRVDELLPGWLDANVPSPFPPDTLIPNKNHRHMRVPEKTNVGALIGETRCSI